MDQTVRFSEMSHSSIINEIATSEDVSRRLQNALNNRIPMSMKEKLAEIGLDTTRTITWFLEESICRSDFAAGRIIDRPEGYLFEDLFFNMISMFDGFKGVPIKKEWMPPTDTSSHWSSFPFDASTVMAYFSGMQGRLSGKRAQTMLFIVSVGLAILGKHNQIRVHRSNWMQMLTGIITQFTKGLLEAFIAVSPLVQADLDKNAIACNLFTRKRKTELVNLPPIESLLQFPDQMPVTLPAVPVHFPDTTPFFIPKTVHPSWLSAPSFAPILNALSAPQPPLYTPPTYPFTFQPLALPSLAPLQPAVPQSTPLLPSPDVTAVLEDEKVQESRRYTGIRRHIRGAARREIMSFIRDEDLLLPRKKAAKRIMRRQLAETGNCDQERQIVYLISKLQKEKKQKEAAN